MHCADPASHHRLLVNHVNKLREVSGQAHAQVVLIPEANLGFEAFHAINALRRAGVGNWFPINEGKQNSGGVGLHTDQHTKAAMCKAMQELLEFDAISISRGMACISMSVDNVLKQLFTEMRNFSIVVEPAKNAFGQAKQAFSGKLGGQQDDLIVALQLCILGMKRFMHKPEYAALR